MTAFVNGDGALEPGRADELDRLVRRPRGRDAVEVAELVGAEAQRRRTGGSSLRTGRRPSRSIAWSSVRTRCTVP